MTSRMRRVFRRHDKGESLIALLVAMTLGAVILVSVMGYWLTQSKASATNVQHQSAQGESLTVANRVSREIQVAEPIIYAATNEIITQTTDSANNVVRVRYRLDANRVVQQQTWKNAPLAYNYTAPGWSAVPSTSVAKAVRDSSPLFRYYDSTGVEITTLPLTAENGGTLPIARVDIQIASDVGSGGVALKTSAAVRNKMGVGTIATVVTPGCPVLTLSPATVGGSPKLTWSTIAGSTAYQVMRNGAEVHRAAVVAGLASYSWTDASVTGSPGSPITYRVLAIAPAGASASCAPAVWTPSADAPVITSAKVLPLAQDDSTAWISSGLAAPAMELNWPTVPGASGYIVMRREVNTSTYSPLAGSSGAWAEIQRTAGAGTTRYSFSDPGYARAYEFYVMATSRSGNSVPSPIVRLLSHPAPATVSLPTPSLRRRLRNESCTPGGRRAGVTAIGLPITRAGLSVAQRIGHAAPGFTGRTGGRGRQCGVRARSQRLVETLPRPQAERVSARGHGLQHRFMRGRCELVARACSG